MSNFLKRIPLSYCLGCNVGICTAVLHYHYREYVGSDWKLHLGDPIIIGLLAWLAAWSFGHKYSHRVSLRAVFNDALFGIAIPLAAGVLILSVMLLGLGAFRHILLPVGLMALVILVALFRARLTTLWRNRPWRRLPAP